MTDFIPNSFQVPNALIDEVISTMNPNSLKCYLVIVRKTVGWKKEWDKISTTQLMQLTGIKRKDTIYKAVEELEKIGLIECSKEQGKLTCYRLVLKNRTTLDKPVLKNRTATSTKKPYPTKDTKQNKYIIFLDYLKTKVKYKTKVSKTKDGENLFKQIEDKRQLIFDYLKHQEDKKEFSVRITAFMEDYKTVYKKQKVEKYRPCDSEGNLL